MRRGEVIGAEALVRWNHREQGLRLPGTFLPDVEDSDLDIRIGVFVIAEVVAQMSKWERAGFKVPVSINVSARHLQSPEFVGFLRQTMATWSNVAPSSITLEIVETTAVLGVERISAIMHQCAAIGFGFALDDFGTGYSSLTLLRRLPVNEVKIDQTFVYNVLDNKGDLAIIQGVVALANAFKCELVAEGVTTVEHGVKLLSMGCDRGQGMGISPPMPADQLMQWAQNWRQPRCLARILRRPRKTLLCN